MKPSRAMLMAAGLGTRLRPFTEKISKPLIPILGVPCAAFAVEALKAAGVSRVVANIHHHPQKTRQGLTDIFGQIEFSDETGQILGSAGGIKRALPLLMREGPGSFYLLNADTLCSLDLSALAETHARLKREQGVLLTLAILENREVSGETYREIQLDSAGEKILGVGGRVAQGKLYSGCAILEPEALEGVPDHGPSDFLETILQPALSRGKVGAHFFSGEWMDVGSPGLWWKTQLKILERLESGEISALWKRVLENELRLVASGLWTSRESTLQFAPSGWSAPCFWDGSGRVPEELGPHAILYGEAPTGKLGRNGVGFAGDWVSFENCPSALSGKG